MKKSVKFISIFALLFLPFLLSGCIRVYTGMNMKIVNDSNDTYYFLAGCGNSETSGSVSLRSTVNITIPDTLGNSVWIQALSATDLSLLSITYPYTPVNDLVRSYGELKAVSNFDYSYNVQITASGQIRFY